MLVAPAANNALDAQPHEKQVCQGVDNLSGVYSGIVVLDTIVNRGPEAIWGSVGPLTGSYFFAPVEGRGDRVPEPGLGRRVRERGNPLHICGMV